MTLDVDLAPTFLDLADVPIPAHMQGKSLLPLASAADPSFRKEWYYEYYEWPNPEKVPPCRGIRTERYKLIQYTLDPQEFELYDLERDPKETENLHGLPEVAALEQHLLERLQALRAAVPERRETSAK
jgi:arylsulfatase A-like enzyme